MSCPVHIVLYEPEIPPNTGNIMRLAANTGAHLHLIHPLGFELDERRLRRAGLDYREFADVIEHPNLDSYRQAHPQQRLIAMTTKASHSLYEHSFQANDALLFGPETRGLPKHVLEQLPASQRLRLPMLPERRSLNLSNAVAVSIYEAWRQLGFPADPHGEATNRLDK